MRTFGNIGTYVSVGTFYPYPYSPYGYGSCDNIFPEYAKSSIVKSTLKKITKLAALPKNYFKANMVVFHKKFGRGRVKVLNDTSIAVMFDDIDYRLKVFDKKIVLSERLLLNEVDNKTECNKLN